MSEAKTLVLQAQRHLKWRALDAVERALMVLCGVAITGFTVTVICDIATRMIGRPWLWLQEVTMTFFIYGVFIGAAAATRRNDHLYLAVLAESMSGRKRLAFEVFNRTVVLIVALCMIRYGYLNFLDGFRSLRMPSMTPLASLYAAIPLCGILVALFTVEQLVNGWNNGFAEPGHSGPGHPGPGLSGRGLSDPELSGPELSEPGHSDPTATPGAAHGGPGSDPL